MKNLDFFELTHEEMMHIEGGSPYSWILGGLAYDFFKYCIIETHNRQVLQNLPVYHL